jgi:hypothetical protein
MRIRIASRVASAAVSVISPVMSSHAFRVRFGGAVIVDLLISDNVRILIYTVRAVTEVAAVAVYTLYVGGSYINDL